MRLSACSCMPVSGGSTSKRAHDVQSWEGLTCLPGVLEWLMGYFLHWVNRTNWGHA